MTNALADSSLHPSPSEISALSQRVGKVLRAFGVARGADRLTSDEVLVFLALGHLGQTANSYGVAVRPVTCLDLAEMLSIPKETVRRKLARLVDLQLAETTGRGTLILDQEEWRRIAGSVVGAASC